VAYAEGAIRPASAQGKLDSASAGFYDIWKARYFRTGCAPGQAYIFYNREKSASRGAISVSEGHGYGMLLTAFFAGHDPAAQDSFDQLFSYFRAHQSHLTPNLMSWQQFEGCVDKAGDNDSASDGDLDIAYALLLADKQWGSAGSIHYRDEALKVILAVKAGDVNPAIPSLKAGDWAEPDMAQANDTRVSDFMPGHLRVFALASGDPIWTRLLEKGYGLVAHLQSVHSSATGLLPDFVQHLDSPAPVPARRKYMESAFDGQYFYNACRCPWRIGVDYLVTGDPRAKAALEKLNEFIEKKTGDDPEQIRAGYTLVGKVIHDEDTSLAFTAPFGVAAMVDPSHQKWLDRLWTKVVGVPAEEDDYYGNTIKLLSMVAMSGNWWSP
jgi:endo-1,4-beta-D-glucanase Y